MQINVKKKRYCQCFAASKTCEFTCKCSDCYNTVYREEERLDAMAKVLRKNPVAFAKISTDEVSVMLRVCNLSVLCLSFHVYACCI
jgi:hypothetical protein